MRAGGCTVQQALTTEAAAVVKQAMSLARRRGHAQVTPLHVANTMLSFSTGLLRTACLQSHSHPLQCRALELCFNVALNRLPASTSSPILGTHPQQQPSISNALVAAFKRAQAHQRRGSIENQQQPLLAVKIELEQLIISILDDPSVSRVMREAGFSSTQVKSNVEQAVSLEICSQHTASDKSKDTANSNNNALAVSHTQEGAKTCSRSPPPTSTTTLDPIKKEDVMTVIENLVSKRKGSLAIVGECLNSIELVVKRVMDKVNEGDVPNTLREVKFISFPISSLSRLSSKIEVDQKLDELKGLVRSYLSKGVVLNLGDLKWVVEYRANNNLCPMEHMIIEIGKLASGISENNGKFWLMGIATFQTYMKCKLGHPSLETIWGLHALTIPAGSLRLSLITDSGPQSQSTSTKIDNQNGSKCWIILEDEEEKQLTCCADCTSKFENEVRSFQSSTCNSDSATSSSLPAWLQQYKHDNKGINKSNNQDCLSIKDLCKKWNTICGSIHQKPYSSSEKTINFSSMSPTSSSASGFSYVHQNLNLHQNHHIHNWSVSDSEQSRSFRDRISSCISTEPILRMCITDHNKDQFLKLTCSSTPNSTSSSDVMDIDNLHKFKELNAENLKILSNALEQEVPWQKDIIPDIVTTILQCRSGMVRRKRSNVMRNFSNIQAKEDTWLIFQGVDVEAKEKISKELAKLIFGSHNNTVSIALSSYSSTRADSTEDSRNKRSRDEQSCSYIERFAEAVSSNPHRVFIVEDVEQADYCSQIGFKRAIEQGAITNTNGDEVGLHDAIIILSCESFSSRSRACSPPVKQKTDDCNHFQDQNDQEKGQATRSCMTLDLNISIDDDNANEDHLSIDDIGLLESVDRRIIFKVAEV